MLASIVSKAQPVSRRLVRPLTRMKSEVVVSQNVDVTGNKFTCSSAEMNSDLIRGVELLDDAIMNMISLQNDAVPQLRAVLEGDKKCSLAKCMLAFELLRNPPAKLTSIEFTPEPAEAHRTHAAVRGEVNQLLQSLEEDFEDLNVRERNFAAAALAWSEGNYTLCASLLETASLTAESGGDALALRLAQDSYLAIGDTKNAQACVARSLQMLDDSHLLHGHLMGMLAAGYLELGRASDAEEACVRAVERTRGRDSFSLHTLLSTLQYQGRSSEVIATIEEHEEKHSGSGLHRLLYNKACAHTQRGNYNGALRIYDSMIDLIQYRDDEDSNHRTAVNATLATMLLWQICLNAPATSDAHKRWGEPHLLVLWSQIDLTQNSHPIIYDVCKFMALRAAESTLGVGTNGGSHSAFISLGETIEEGYEREYEASSWKPRDSELANRNNSESDQSDSSPNLVQKLYSYVTRTGPQTEAQIEEEKVIQRKADAELALERKIVKSLDVSALLKTHCEKMNADCDRDSDSDRSSDSKFPHLQSVKSKLQLHSRTPEQKSAGYIGNDDKSWQADTYAKACRQALSSYCAADYPSAVQQLLETMPILERLGGSAIIRDVLAQTLIEASLRSNQLLTARVLLSERTTSAPNEAQSWRRLASVFGRMGEKQLAEAAHYTSWQLGIAQGGFGGAR